MVPVLFVSVVYSNFSQQTTHWIHNRKIKLLWIYCQPSVLNSICNKGGYTNEIRKRTTNTSETYKERIDDGLHGFFRASERYRMNNTAFCMCVYVCVFVCVFLWWSMCKWKFKNAFLYLTLPFFLCVYSNYSGCTTDLFRNRDRKVLCFCRQPSVLNSMCNKGGYTKVDIQIRFGKIQGIQRYWFYLFPSCIRILAHGTRLGP